MWLEIQTYPSIVAELRWKTYKKPCCFDGWISWFDARVSRVSPTVSMYTIMANLGYLAKHECVLLYSCLGYHVYIDISPFVERDWKKKSSTIYPGFPSLFPYPLISVTLWRSRGTCAVSLPSPLLDVPWTSPKVFFPWRFLTTRAIGRFFRG